VQVLTLKRRREFQLLAARGVKSVSKSLVLQVLPRTEVFNEMPAEAGLYVGYTVSGRVGGAVVRNRIKRRFRTLVKEVLLPLGDPSFCYVLIGRRPAYDREYAALVKDFKYNLHAAGAYLSPQNAAISS